MSLYFVVLPKIDSNKQGSKTCCSLVKNVIIAKILKCMYPKVCSFCSFVPNSCKECIYTYTHICVQIFVVQAKILSRANFQLFVSKCLQFLQICQKSLREVHLCLYIFLFHQNWILTFRVPNRDQGESRWSLVLTSFAQSQLVLVMTSIKFPRVDESQSRHPINFSVLMSLSLDIKEIFQSQ